MRVLITGGAGYLGTELVKKLVKIPKVKEIIVYDNLNKDTTTFFSYLGLCRILDF